MQLYELFRPEFIMSYPHALSSDAFSGFGKLNMEVHNQEVVTGAESRRSLLRADTQLLVRSDKVPARTDDSRLCALAGRGLPRAE